ncbi:MAG: zinc ribbon domain-containing protein [Limnochordia bacterium]
MKHKLSGLLRCGECGASMVSRRYGSKGPHKERMIFVCSGYQKRGSCRFHYIFIDQADETVYATLEQLADGDIVIPSEDIEKAVQAIEMEHQRRIAAIDAKFQRQIQAYENGLIGERDLQIARDRVEKERELILQERDRIEAPTQDTIRQAVLNQAQQLLWLWESGELPVVQNALRKLFDHVVVINGSISDFRLSPELYDLD